MSPIGVSVVEHIQTLRGELEKRRSKNRAYSLRAFAKHIGLDAGSLSRILNCKQDLSLRSAILVARRLGFTPTESKQFLASVADQKIREITQTLSEAAQSSFQADSVADLRAGQQNHPQGEEELPASLYNDSVASAAGSEFHLIAKRPAFSGGVWST